MRKFLLTLLFIRFGLIAIPTLAKRPLVSVNLLADSSIELPSNLGSATLNMIGFKLAIIEPLTLAPTATPAQILSTGNSRLKPNASGGYTPYQNLSVVGPGTIWPGLGDATVADLPPGVHSFTLIVTDFNNQRATGTVSVTVTPVNTQPTDCSSMYSLKAGSWTNVAVWSCGRLPTGTDVVRLNHAVNLPASYQGQAFQVLYSLTGRLVMEANSKLQLRSN